MIPAKISAIKKSDHRLIMITPVSQLAPDKISEIKKISKICDQKSVKICDPKFIQIASLSLLKICFEATHH
jgi:hypothetical protein